VIPLDAAPADLPARMPSPFGAAHPLARRAAERLLAGLPPLAEGQMFGVLVAQAPDGRVGALHAFAGTLGGARLVEGFAPPLGARITDARGETRALSPGEGECAAPRLLAQAYDLGLRPLALAEVWWGPTPATGGRHAGQLYPACRGRCGPLLGFMLGGLDVEPPPVFGAARIPDDEPRAVFQDEWVIVVDKPVGLLSVPGRDAALLDSVRERLRARSPGLTVVHRLDLDTSGLLLAARDDETYVALQRQFAERLVDKRYVAILDGEVTAEAGTIELPLRVDLDDRPRQIVDPVYGKPALTTWRVAGRDGARTRVHLVPHTGRTHQLRVHAAHPLGIGAPVLGDRLYGREAERLFLHAETLAFTHPRTGARVTLESPAPF
jgi:tRNA pseudouridine32 synthase / 23S rRNA pseudouridine746 synthase